MAVLRARAWWSRCLVVLLFSHALHQTTACMAVLLCSHALHQTACMPSSASSDDTARYKRLRVATTLTVVAAAAAASILTPKQQHQRDERNRKQGGQVSGEHGRLRESEIDG